MKKIFFISLILLIPIVILLAVYNFAFKAKESTQIIDEKNKPSLEDQSMISAEKEKIEKVTDIEIFNPKLDESSETIYYFSKKCQIFKMAQDGTQRKMVDEIVGGELIDAQWSLDGKKVIVQCNENGQNVFVAYSLTEKTKKILKKGLDLAIWDGNGGRIVYKYFDENSKERSLNISNVEGSDWKKIVNLQYKKMKIKMVPNSSLISYWSEAAIQEEGKLHVIGSMGGEPKTLLSGRFGCDYSWAPDGQQALVSSTSSAEDKKIELGVVNLEGEYKDLNIPTTVSKATWSSDSKTLYYSLPTIDILGTQESQGDTFWSVDVLTGSKKRLVELNDINAVYDAAELFLSATEDMLYFLNRKDQKLYRISF